MPWQLSGQAAGLRLRSVRPARPTPPKELPGVPPRAGESVPVGTKTCRLIFLFTNNDCLVCLHVFEEVLLAVPNRVRFRSTAKSLPKQVSLVMRPYSSLHLPPTKTVSIHT